MNQEAFRSSCLEGFNLDLKYNSIRHISKFQIMLLMDSFESEDSINFDS